MDVSFKDGGVGEMINSSRVAGLDPSLDPFDE